MAGQFGLGKGLTALFEENDTVSNAAEMLPILEIEPNADQPRKRFDDEAMAELTASIAEHGVLQPILVRPLTNGGYKLVAGERRWRASRAAGLTEIPAVVREMSEQEAAQLAIIENLQREDLNPMEEALGYQSLMDGYGLTQEQAAAAVGKSRPAVANALRLLKLPEAVTELVITGKLSAGHARAVLALNEPADQIALAEQAVAGGWSVREVEKRAKAKPAQNRGKSAVFGAHAFYEEVALALTEHLGKKVRVTAAGGDKGILQIEFYGDADLQELANRLAPEEK